MVTFREEVTVLVVMVKVALALPAGTVRLAGTRAADVLLLDSDTTAPPVGAGPFSVTVPVELLPPTKVDGTRARVDSEVRPTVRLAVRVTPPYEAEIVTELEADTGRVLIVKVALVAPSGTVTVGGTGATAVLLLDSITGAPPPGAGPFSVTVPVEMLPPTTLEGLRERDDGVARFTVRFEDRVTPPYVPEMLTTVALDTGMVVIVKVALVAPLATWTFAGTVAAVLLLSSVTVAPPPGAGPFNVTVPVEVFPPVTLDGLRDRDDSAVGFTVRFEDLVTPPYEPEMFTAVALDTGMVVIVKVALVAPLATVTFAGGTVAAGSLQPP